jgi:phosphatidylglycerol---prolipoprotein diacylglyceryl transferase
VHPILITIGSFRLPTYGLLLAIALITALYTAVRLGRRAGFDGGQLLDFGTWLIVAGLVGAKVLLILTQWSEYSRHPGEIFSWSTLEAGGVFYGGFIGAALFAVWYVKHYRLNMWRLFDVFAPAVAIGQCIGRLGCFAAGDDYGTPTKSFLGVVFTSRYAHDLDGVPLGVPIHPVQLYESFLMLVIFGILIWQFGRKRFDGQIFWLYVVLYAVARFFLEFFRGDPIRGFVFNGLLSTSQFIAILALITAGTWAVTTGAWRRGLVSAAAGGEEGSAKSKRGTVAVK